MKRIYTATMTNTGARNGKAISPDGSFSLQMVTPAEMGGNGKDPGTNPEQLFAATYSSCFNGALQHILRLNKVSFESSTVRADVSLVEDPSDSGFQVAATLTVSIKGLSLDQAKDYTNKAHLFCPYSKAIRGNVDVQIEVVE
ncbi:MAG: organic hydroperoxide resistance protein [Eubacteriales bacterium]